MTFPVHSRSPNRNDAGHLGRREVVVSAAILATLPARATANITIIDQDLAYPEGPLLIGDELFVADMLANRLVVYDANRLVRKRTIILNSCGPTSIAQYGNNQLLVLCHTSGGLALLNNREELVASILQTSDGTSIRYPNDSVSDGRGGVFLSNAGIFSLQAPATGSVVHVSAHGANIIVKGLRYSNGIAFQTQPRRIFVSEHLANRILEFDLDPNLRVTSRRVFFNLSSLPQPNVPRYDQMGPDGLELLGNGDLLAAQYGAGRFIRISARGDLKEITQVPCQFITNITRHRDDVFFVGAYDLSVLQVRGILGKVPIVDRI